MHEPYDDIEINREEAKEIFKNYMKEHGVEEVTLLMLSDQGQFWEFQCLKPYGLFLLNKITGDIIDNYGVFE